MKYAIKFIGPIVVFFNIDGLKNYTSGIFNDASCSLQKNHAALAVGYGTDKQTGLDYWIVKNSWGTVWGLYLITYYMKLHYLCNFYIKR